MQFNTEKMALLQYHKSYLGFYIVAIRKKKQGSSRDMLRIRWYHQAGKKKARKKCLGKFLHFSIFHFFIHLRGIKNTLTRSKIKSSMKKQIKHWGRSGLKCDEREKKLDGGWLLSIFSVFYLLCSILTIKITKKNLSIWLINDKILLALENWYSRRIVFLSLFQGGLGFKLVPLVLLPPRRTLPLPRRWRLGTADIPTPDRSCWIRPR